MIPRIEIGCQTIPWQRELQQAVTSITELCHHLQLDPSQLPISEAAARDFPLLVPLPFVRRMRRGDANDPLLLQVLPTEAEIETAPGYSEDPLGERQANPLPGLVHKYHGRVLLVTAPHCAVNCRYCFRRHFDYGDNTPGRQGWQAVIDYIGQREDISEVIYSGGDPLGASDRQLSWLSESLAAIPHLRRLRIHTRLPLMIPSRIDDSCLQWLAGNGLQTVLVLHCNHPREIDAEVAEACQRLRDAGVTLLNQSVLLAGINDDAHCLAALSERLFGCGVLPYYLHQLDAVAGAAHFAVDLAKAQSLASQLLELLPGYLVPRLVREDAGAKSKTPIGPTVAVTNCDMYTSL